MEDVGWMGRTMEEEQDGKGGRWSRIAEVQDDVSITSNVSFGDSIVQYMSVSIANSSILSQSLFEEANSLHM